MSDTPHGYTADIIAGRHGDIPIRRYGMGTEPLIWLHGGAFAWGDLDMPESHAVARALSARHHVVTVDYRRVPPFRWIGPTRRGALAGIRYPVPLEDVLDAVAAVAREYPSGRVALGGASAGACLAAAAALRIRDEKGPALRGLVLAYGTFHGALPLIGHQLRSRIRGVHAFRQLRPSVVDRMNVNYAGSRDALHAAYAFPGGKDLHALPHTLVVDADRDSLRASGSAFATELRAHGVQTTEALVENALHGFLNRPGRPEFATGVRHIEQHLRAIDSSRRTSSPAPQLAEPDV